MPKIDRSCFVLARNRQKKPTMHKKLPLSFGTIRHNLAQLCIVNAT